MIKILGILLGTVIVCGSDINLDLYSSCLGSLSQNLVLPANESYALLATGERNRVQRFPAGILLIKNETEITKAITCGYLQNIKSVARSGGHSYESFSAQDGSITIDISAVSGVEMISKNESSNTALAVVRAGTRLGNVYRELWDLGNYTFNAGTCPTVGIGGLISGGGYGLLSRLYGLSIDQTIGMDVVLFNGTAIKVTKYEHPDLFWALRGGGSGSFGIITHYYINVFKIPPVTMFVMHYDKEHRFDLIEAWMKYFPHADNRLTTQLKVFAHSIHLSGQFTGPRLDFDRVMSDSGVHKIAGLTLNWVVENCTALGAKAFTISAEASNYKGYCDTNSPSLHPDAIVNFKDSGKYKSDFSDSVFPPTAIRMIVDSLSAAPSIAAWIQFEAIGGVISKYSNQETPYNHRESLFSMQYMIGLPVYESVYSPKYQWIAQFENNLKAYTNGHHYQNYPDLDLGDRFGIGYFGHQNFERLKGIKRMYDPSNLFTNEQSIPIGLY